MIWDLVILFMGSGLAIAGWQLGIINSWPAPIAMILSTACTQLLYVHLGAFTLEETRLPGDLAYFISYVMIWIALEMIFEALLLLLLPIKKRFTANIPSRALGMMLGIAKAVTVLVFAAAAGASSITLPTPPEGSAIVGWMCETTHGSVFLRSARGVAAHMPIALAQRVVSEESPIFKPTFGDQAVLKVNALRARKWHELFNGLRAGDDDISQL